QGALGVDGIASQQQLVRPRLADEPRQALRAAPPRDDPELYLRLTESCRLRRDADVARHAQLAAAAEGDAVDGGDDRQTRALELDPDHIVQYLRHHSLPVSPAGRRNSSRSLPGQTAISGTAAAPAIIAAMPEDAAGGPPDLTPLPEPVATARLSELDEAELAE